MKKKFLNIKEQKILFNCLEKFIFYYRPKKYLKFLEAALKYDNAEDPQSVELQDKIKANGVKAALKEVSGITDEKILDDVVAIYEAM